MYCVLEDSEISVIHNGSVMWFVFLRTQLKSFGSLYRHVKGIWVGPVSFDKTLHSTYHICYSYFFVFAFQRIWPKTFPDFIWIKYSRLDRKPFCRAVAFLC